MRDSQKVILAVIGALLLLASVVLIVWAVVLGAAAFEGPGWWVVLSLVCGTALGVLVALTVVVLARFGPGSVGPVELRRIRSLRPGTTVVGTSVPLFSGALGPAVTLRTRPAPTRR